MSADRTPASRTLAAALRGLLFGAGFVCAVAGAVALLNCVQLRRADPLNSPLRLEAIRAAQSQPANADLVAEARRLDLLARRAFFSAQTLAEQAGRLLWIGAALILGAIAGARWLEPRVAPPPAPLPTPDVGEREARAARRAVAAYLALLIAGGAAAARTLRARPAGAPGDVAPPPTTNQPALPEDSALAEAWPSFRGHFGRGGRDRPAPTRWDVPTGRNVRWSIEVPRPGFSSPIFWNSRVFLTGADTSTAELYAFCADTGRLLWRHEARDVPGSPRTPPKTSEEVGLAAPTPTTDGLRVYAMFGTGDLIACDLEGRRLWARHLGSPKNPYGHSSSPIAVRGRLIVQFDDETGGRLLALDGATGRTIWETRRDVRPGWSTPVAAEHNGRLRIGVLAQPFFAVYDWADGRELWRVPELEAEIGTSPAFADGRWYAGNDNTRFVAADDVDGRVLWETDEDLPDVASPLVWRGLVVLAASSGIVTARDAATGEKLWSQEWEEGFYASPVAAGEAIYLLDRAGRARVVRAARQFELIAENPVGEECGATPALAGDRLYLRTRHRLIAIEEATTAPTAP
ncbi:MAG: PQQ-binding-like beta-propeller repeat protein [Kiritimatiellae bacterium]|nr:PQQ-binding-like beta-propeller repeat protein [Kiritimatiellia bacterium]